MIDRDVMNTASTGARPFDAHPDRGGVAGVAVPAEVQSTPTTALQLGPDLLADVARTVLQRMRVLARWMARCPTSEVSS
jgi:hypothetical protein